MKRTAHQDIVSMLKSLRRESPDADFRIRMEQKVSRLSPVGTFTMPLFALRVAVVVFLVLFGTANMVHAASLSKPGEVLYPVKQLVDTVRTSFTADKSISTTPTTDLHPVRYASPSPTPAPEQIPTPTIENEQQTLPASDYQAPESEATQTPTPTLTPTPKEHGAIPPGQAVSATVHSEKSSQPTPTPQSNPPGGGHTNEGSKDNGSNAGAGGSLLPKINIRL
jgi:hypothetical protein